ncbi:uncharacterized protein LOC124134310 [Haliotis rufescens]|uniref:uncharacterized protein LOC124134310 n=1 Tax=Haliotis rufescens TaxID=6454 RepID=UPI00201F5B23|nr:uncharacterized protein LOC124134310 [Haliotis rufescens]
MLFPLERLNMLFLVPLLVNLIVVSGQTEPCNIGGVVYQPGERYMAPGGIPCKMVKCGNTADIEYGCRSQLNSTQCLKPNDVEEMDCVTYTCTYHPDVAHGVLTKDPVQETRCSIDGKCFSAGEGPNLCTKCLKNDDGTTGILAGCLLEDGTCASPGSEVKVGCEVKACAVRNNVVTIHTVSTTGCRLQGQCYKEGTTKYRIGCVTCKRNSKTGMHHWGAECLDIRNYQCFKEGAIHDFFCNSLICSNRGGIGWWYHDAPSCQVSPQDCVVYNTTSVREGFCYYCDHQTGGPPSVACNQCGKCLRPGESVNCPDGKKYTCEDSTIGASEKKVICKVNGESFAEDTNKTIDCNTFQCTKYGIKRLTAECGLGGKCYKAGEMVDKSRCLTCVAEGNETRLEEGCKHQDKCYNEGETIRLNCKTMLCVRQANGMRFIEDADQPTPCRCHKECYPVGPFSYANDKICAVCRPDGKIDYSCKMSNGECLQVNQEEESPVLGCYRMKCTFENSTRTLKIDKAPGQPLQCLLPDSTCLKEGEKKEINGQRYRCTGKDMCIVGDKDLPLGDSMQYYCHELVCEEEMVNGRKTLQTFIKEYGCKVGDSCKKLNETFDINCDKYQCKLAPGDKYAKPAKIQELCSFNGNCIEKGKMYMSDNCVNRECNSDAKLVVKDIGCKSTLTGTCLKVGESVTVGGKKEQCGTNSNSNSNSQTGSSSSTTSRMCRVSTGQDVAYNDTIDIYCNTRICQTRNGVTNLYVVGKPQCQITANSKKECFDAGTTKYCVKCNFNSVTQSVSFEQTCIGDNGACVAPGETAPYRCGTAICNSATYKMDKVEKKQCAFSNGVSTKCIPADGFAPITSGGKTYDKCTCKNPDTNSVKCFF